MNDHSFYLKECSYCYALIFLFLFPGFHFAQGPAVSDKVSLTRRYLESVADFGYAGQVLIAEKDQIRLQEAYGLANREKILQTTPGTVFGIASVSKAFTAIAVLLLEKEGKLSTKDSLGHFFTNCPPDKAGITVHQLLTHSAGISGGDFVADYAALPKTDLLNKILATPLRAKPGRRWMYSNAGYNLLAAIIERQSGLDYNAYLRRAVLNPFKLQHTFLAGESLPSDVALAVAYQGAVSNTSPSAMAFNVRTWGGGSLCSTAEDLYLLKKALYNEQLFGAALRQKMFARYLPINNDGYSYYGYGCLVYKSPRLQQEVIDFTGETERGFNCTVRILPEKDEVYISTSNAKHAGETWNRWFLDPHLRNLWWEETHFALPPLALLMDRSTLLKYTGVYTFQDSKVEVRLEGYNLIAEAFGKEALALLYPQNQKILDHWENMEKAVATFFSSYQEDNTNGFSQVLSQNQLPGFVEERDALLQEMGAFKGYQLKGIFPDADPNFLKCPLVLEFEKGSIEMFTLWNLQKPGQPMLDYSAPGEKTSIAKILAAIKPHTFSSYNFFKDSVDLTLIFDLQNNQAPTLADEQANRKFIKVS